MKITQGITEVSCRRYRCSWGSWMGSGLVSTYYRQCNLIHVSENQLCFLWWNGSAGPWTCDFLHFGILLFFPERTWNQQATLPRPCSANGGIWVHLSPLFITCLFDLINHCSYLSTSNGAEVASFICSWLLVTHSTNSAK